MEIHNLIAQELQKNPASIAAAISLLDQGDTVPFIARYRKEATGGLTDNDLRILEERLIYLRDLESRKQTILKSIDSQGKLTAKLNQQILSTLNKTELEDLYLPYKPKRRTKAQIAREAGLEPLAELLMSENSPTPDEAAQGYLNPDQQISTSANALEGARYIIMERLAENAELLGKLREYVWQHGEIHSTVIEEKRELADKFSDYFAYQEALAKIPSHRALALLRGQREQYLQISLKLSEADSKYCLVLIEKQLICYPGSKSIAWLTETAEWTWRIKLLLKIELELITRMRENAEIVAIQVFANNLKNLLMASPAGARRTMGLDPGFRTGVKVVIVDETGKLLTHAVIYPHHNEAQWQSALTKLQQLCQAYQVDLISIGNGTASRETDRLVSTLKKQNPHLNLTSIVVSEAGASVYSASETAAKEFPELDVSFRGAISIARRLQDPLAELVKIEPKAIGVGQYQHDVNQVKLNRHLKAIVEDCVNAVGVDLNTASAPLLAYVSGINDSIAKNIIAYRDQHGCFNDRLSLKKIPRLGDKTFEQAAGFLRILNGSNPLDASAVHPEAYPVVEKILHKANKSIKDVMGNAALLKNIKPYEYVSPQFGLPTISDILKELEKPGRDPRPSFKTALFQEGVESIKDLAPGMILEGVITNVANFGAFVDIGVHQDGLVHISMLADHFVKDPNTVVKVGDVVNVRVIEIDIKRQRIQLSMRSDNKHQIAKSTSQKPANSHRTKPLETALGAAFKSLLSK